jgi:hypothetical protein
MRHGFGTKAGERKRERLSGGTELILLFWAKPVRLGAIAAHRDACRLGY